MYHPFNYGIYFFWLQQKVLLKSAVYVLGCSFVLCGERQCYRKSYLGDDAVSDFDLEALSKEQRINSYTFALLKCVQEFVTQGRYKDNARGYFQFLDTAHRTHRDSILKELVDVIATHYPTHFSILVKTLAQVELERKQTFLSNQNPSDPDTFLALLLQAVFLKEHRNQMENKKWGDGSYTLGETTKSLFLLIQSLTKESLIPNFVMHVIKPVIEKERNLLPLPPEVANYNEKKPGYTQSLVKDKELSGTLITLFFNHKRSIKHPWFSHGEQAQALAKKLQTCGADYYKVYKTLVDEWNRIKNEKGFKQDGLYGQHLQYAIKMVYKKVKFNRKEAEKWLHNEMQTKTKRLDDEIEKSPRK